MTARALAIGLALGLGIAAFGYANDWVLRQSYVAGDLMPVSVYGLLLAALLVVNPLMRLFRLRTFSGGEYAVVISLMLVAAVIPGPGLMWTFSQTLMMPHHFQRLTPGWQDKDLVGHVPEAMLTDPGPDERRAVQGFVRGLKAESGAWIHPADVPWGAWVRPLAFWVPFVALSLVASVCLMMILHEQWSRREHLPYPVAVFAGSLLRGTEGGWPDILRNRGFRVGFGLVFAIFVVNGYCRWNPESFEIPLAVDLSALASLWPDVMGEMPLTPACYFAAVGLAYLIRGDASLSVGIAPFLYALVLAPLTAFGVRTQGQYLSGGLMQYQLFGAYAGLVLVTLYVGRRYYGRVALRTLGMGGRDDCAPAAAWCGRGAAAAGLGMVLLLVAGAGLHWLPAVLVVGLSGLLFLGVARINAETGMFFVQPYWHAAGVVCAFFGVRALGANGFVGVLLVSAVLTIDPRVCLMPMVANALKLAETQQVNSRRLGGWLLGGVLAALLVGVFATLYVQYNEGAVQNPWLAMPARMPFEALDAELWRLEDRADVRSEFRLGDMAVDTRLLWGAAAGLILVLACGAARLRYAWWPIHPILFLIWGTWPASLLAWSFLLGWLARATISALGGSQLYRRMRPVFIGLIAGEFAAGIFWLLVNLTRCACGLTTKPFMTHP